MEPLRPHLRLLWFISAAHQILGTRSETLEPYVDHLVLANNATAIMWPLAVATRIYPHGVVLLWIQDLAIVAAELVVVTSIATSWSDPSSR